MSSFRTIQRWLIFVCVMLMFSFIGYGQQYAIDSIAIPLSKKTTFHKITVLEIIKNDTIIIEEVYLNDERKVFKRISRLQYYEDPSTLILTYDSLERVAEELKFDIDDQLTFKRKWSYEDISKQNSVTTNAKNEITEHVSYSFVTSGDTSSLSINSIWPQDDGNSFERYTSIKMNDSVTISSYLRLDDQGNEDESSFTYRKVIDSLGFKAVTEGNYYYEELLYDDPYLFENYDQSGKLIKTSLNGTMPYTTYLYNGNERIIEETWDWKYINEDETAIYLVDRVLYTYSNDGLLIKMKSKNVEYYFNYSN